MATEDIQPAVAPPAPPTVSFEAGSITSSKKTNKMRRQKQPRASMYSSIYREFKLKTGMSVENPKEEQPRSSLMRSAKSAPADLGNENNKKSLLQKISLRKSNKSSPELNPQGRLYSTQHSLQPGGIRVDDCIYGIKMAHLSRSDDSEERLEGASANTMKTLEHMLGDDPQAARLPLSTILQQYFNLNLDCWMDESGIKKLRFVDTQGFIASSNDDTIVLSYRFSTTLYDWATNLDMTSSEWEPDVDERIGHAGYCSCLDGWFTKYCTSRGKPRVHTGFYNNFIYTIPYIRQHIIDKVLPKDGTDPRSVKPKNICICGASLGAAIATLAYVFVLQELHPYLKDPDFPSHKIICVTAGSPRVGDRQFRAMVQSMMKDLRPLDRAVNARMVYNHDVVPHVPFHVMRFVHLDKLVYITKDGEYVIINPNLQILKCHNFREIRHVYQSFYKQKHAEAQKLAKDTQEGAKKLAKDTQQGAEKLAKDTQQGAEKLAKDTQQLITGEKTDNDAGNDGKESNAIITSCSACPVAPGETEKAFAEECENSPEPIHDHMPHWYLEALEKLKEKEDVIQMAYAEDTVAAEKSNEHKTEKVHADAEC